MKKQKVLLSTDIGSDVDDALALKVMLEEPGIDLRGIYTVNGDVTSRALLAKHAVALHSSIIYRFFDRIGKSEQLNLSYKNKERLSDLRAKLLSRVGKDITVAVGDAEPIFSVTTPYAFFEDGLVDDVFFHRYEIGEVDRKMRSLEEMGIKEDAVKDMADKLAKGKHSIFSIGPMTSVARLLKEHSEVKRNIDRIYIMGTRFSYPNERDVVFDGGFNEHNVRYDSGAAKEVLESDVPLLIVPGDLCNYKMPISGVLDYEKKGGNIRNYVDGLLAAFVGKKTAIEIGRGRGQHIGETDRDLFQLFEFLTSIIAPNNRFPLGVNMGDPYYAALEADEFFAEYRALFGALQNCDHEVLDVGTRREAMKRMADALPTDVSISDVYVPYVFLHQDRIKTEGRKVTCDLEGRTIEGIGKEHEVVVDLDWSHFENFIEGHFPRGYK